MNRPPLPLPADAPGPLVALADRCVQCGLCLPACPTYRLDGIEAESPRGRIALARAWALGAVEPTRIGDTHLDQCLGCRSCEAVCPAGVEYGALLVAARAGQRERRAPGWRERVVEWLAARPLALARLLGPYRRVFPLLPMRWRPLPRPPGPARATPEVRDARGSAGHTEHATRPLAVFVGCVAGTYERDLRRALATLCDAAGLPAPTTPPGQACCGTLHAHAGDVATAARLAARNRDAFAGSATVLTLASGCHEAVAAALDGTAATRDALSFLATHADRLAFRPTPARVALHLPCTQRNVVHGADATRALLARIPMLDVVPLDAGFGCCGAAGTQMFGDPARATAFRAPLLEQLAASGATHLLSANIGCRLHFAGATPVPVQHPLEFLAECLAP